MAVILPVHLKLDDNAVKDTTQQAQTLFEGLGSTSGEIFMQGMQTAFGRAGDVFSNVSAAAESMGSGIESSALIGAAGIAGIGFAAIKLGEELYSVGDRFDSIFDNLAIRTGKTGDDLAALEDTVRRVGDTTAATFEQLGQIAGQLSQAFDLGAGPTLDDLTHRIGTLDRMLGQDLNIREFGQLLRGFDIDAANAATVINELTDASQRSMIPVNSLVSSLQSAGPAARILGLNLEETASLLVSFEKSGLDAGNTTMALSRAATVFSEHNIDLKTGLDDTVTQMKAFIDANNESAAVALAKDVFGARAARNFVDAVKDGTLTVKSLHDGLGPVGDKLTELDNQTRDWSENWTMLKNNVTDLAETFAGPLFDGINKALGVLNDFMAGMKEPLPQPPGAPGDSSAQALGDLLGAPSGAPAPGQPGFIGPVDTGQAPPPQGSVADVLPPMILSDRPQDQRTPQDIAGALADKPAASSGAGLGPQVPYPAEYTAGVLPGETSQQYNARMSRIEADHKVAQAQAEVEAVTKDEKHSAEELQRAENNLAKALQDRQQNELRISEQKTKGPGIDVAVPYAPDFGNGPQPGETSQQFSARTALLEAQHRSAEEYAKLRQMESSGVATQNEIINQKNKVLEAQRAQQAAEMRLNDAYSKQVEDATKGMDALGAGLDKDLGLSKGLAGLADNLVRFLGNLAAAPLMGQLNAISAAQGGPGATGSGLIAMAAAGGAFGSDYVVGGYDQSGKPVSVTQMQAAGSTSSPQYFSSPAAAQQSQQSQASALQQQRTPYGLPAGANSGGYGGSGVDFPPWVDQIASAFGLQPSTYAGHQSGNRNEPGYAPNPQGLNRGIDWSGPVPNMQAFADYLAANPQYVEQAIWQNPNTGRREGIAGGRDVTNTGYYADDYAAHGNHVHTRQSMSIPLPGDMNYGGQPQLHDAGLLGSSAGAIPPGTTVVQNNTGANEHIATPAQLGDIMGAGWGPGGRPPSPGVGNDGMGASSGKGDGPTQIGGSEPKSQNGASAGGGGGLFGAAVGAGSMAADAFAPGSGAAVQIAGQEIQRAIKAGGQFAGIVAGGLMETFLPAGASQIANDNWITRVGGAFAGLAPQLPNMAGKAPTPVPNKAPGQPAMPVFPGAPGTDKPKDGASPTFNVTLNANGPIEDKHVDQMTGALQRQYETGMAQVGGR